MLYLLILCQNLVGKIWCQNIEWGRGEWKAPHNGHNTPRKNFVPPLCWGGPEWLGGKTGVGDYCKQRSDMSYRTPSQMWDSWYLPSFLFNGG